MIQDLSIVSFSDKNYYKKLVKSIRNSGYCILKDYICIADLKKLDDFCNLAVSNPNNLAEEYLNGKLASLEISLDEDSNSISYLIKQKIKKIIKYNSLHPKRKFNHKLKNQFQSILSINKLEDLIKKLKYDLYYSTYNEKRVYITLDNKFTSHSAQSPHFDWRPSLKSMIYLDDCEEINKGGLHYLPKSHKNNLNLIGSKRLNGLFPGKNDADSYSKKFLKKKIKFNYCGAKRGSILFFNTDGFHFQGQNSQIKFNRIIRIHSYIHKLNLKK